MPLPILVAIVAFGIALTVAAIHFTGGSKLSEILSSDHARDLFLTDFPNEHPGAAALTTDRHSAFMPLPNGRVAIVQSFGDGFFTRMVSASDIAAISQRPPATISIRFKDFTWTGGHFHFDDASVATGVGALLGAKA